MEGAATGQAQAEAQAEAEQGKVEVGAGVEADEEEEVVAKAQTLMDKITSSPDTPSPAVLHSLSSLLETHEARYLQATDHSSTNVRASHTIGRLGNLIRDNDEFFELVSSKYLSENRFSASVQAAAARLLLSCSLGWMYPPVFEDASLDNIKRWVMDETDRSSAEDPKFKLDPGRNVASDYEMLKTYATGLLAISLSNVGQLVEDVLTCGLSAKLMHYLRMRVLGDAGQRDAGHLGESKSMPLASSGRVREESRGRIRPFVDVSHAEDVRVPDERSLDDQDSERNHDGDVHRQAFEEDHWIAREPPDSLMGGLQTHDVDVDVTDRMYSRDARDEKSKFGEFDERDESSRRKTHRGGTKSRGKGRVSEGAVENEPLLTSPGSGGRLGLGRNAREKPSSRHTDVKKVQDTRKLPTRSSDGSTLERDDFVDLIEGCRVGSRDISDLVKEAIRAAEAEAREANAPAEAIRAAAAAAAEVVKSAAFEEFKNTNDEDAAVLAASKAASTVIDAANAVEVSRRSISAVLDSTGPSAAEETDEDVNDYFLPDRESLAQLREKYCIQCLVILGEYVEVLGPVLHEKGVDVCLALLQRSSKNKEPSKIAVLLPEVMKLICALAAHRKFAALFVDRGGMQRLLSVPRVAQTFFGLSSCLFTIGSIQGIMERVCALPSDLVHQVVELAIELLECSQDQARKNAALFFAAAFVFRAVLDAFDAQDGLQKLLGVLNDAASVRSGVNSVSLGLSNSGSLRSDRSSPEVLTSSLKQIAYHTCVALRQYFRAHLLLIVDSIRPSKTNRSAPRNITSVRAAYKPLDISNEAMDAVFLQLQKDRKLGPAFVRTRWPAVDKFLAANGHVTMLELCQAPPVERYLHDLLQYALGVLHIVTLVPQSRKMIVNSTLSNERVGIAVILDAANIASTYVDPEIIQPALSVLINLVCPPPSISNRPPIAAQGQLSVSAQSSNGLAMESRDRNAERSTSDRTVCVTSQHDLRERNGESAGVERGGNTLSGTQSGSAPQTSTSGLVGDRRISLGAGAGSAGLAAQLEQGYRQARDAVRANNGIKVLLHLLQPRIYSPPAALDCIRALACRVLLGLARDDTIAHILTKLQVGKKLSELIRDSGGQTPGGEQGRWQSELAQVAIELIAIVTNSGRASTIAATDAATPTLRRIERAAIAAATPITYHSRELLLLIHEHLQACGLGGTAAMLLKEAQLTPLPSMVAPASLSYTSSMQESSSIQLQWPSGRAPWGFFSEKPRSSVQNECPSVRCDSVALAKKKQLAFSLSFGSQSRNQASFYDGNLQSGKKIPNSTKQATVRDIPIEATAKPGLDNETPCKTPIILPMKRKHSELKDGGLTMSVKRLQVSELGLRSPAPLSPYSFRRGGFSVDTCGFSTPNSSTRDINVRSTPGVLSDVGDDTQYVNSQVGQVTSTDQGFLSDPHSTNVERLTLDSLVVQYLKHQHRQCPAPITTLPPLSLLHPHVCPEPKRSLDAPLNVTARLGTREFRNIYGGVHGNRRDRQFVYSRFRPWRTCRDDNSPLLTCLAFLGNSSHIVAGSHAGELKIFDTNSNSVLDSCTSHQSPLVLVQPYLSGETQLLLTSSIQDVRLWDASSIGNGPLHPFEGCKAARFSNSGTHFAALSSDSSGREILLYDIQTYQMELKLSDSSVGSTGRALMYSHIHFSPSDTMLLWNGVLWDRRVSGPVHRFDQFTDYGGGGFHPAGNEVIINSEVWDLRKFRLLRSVPSLDQTTITFNARGDIIYAILRRSLEDVMSAVHTRRVKHPLFAAFRTVDAINYSDIATVPVDRCVLDFATEPTDSFVGLITMDDQDEMLSSGRVYEIGRRRPTDDDSDPDDAESEEDDEEDEDDDADVDPLLGPDIDGDTDSDPDNMSNDDDSVSDDEDEEDGDFLMDDLEFDGGAGILEIMTEGEDEDEENQMVESFSSDEDDLLGNGFGF